MQLNDARMKTGAAVHPRSPPWCMTTQRNLAAIPRQPTPPHHARKRSHGHYPNVVECAGPGTDGSANGACKAFDLKVAGNERSDDQS